MVVVTKFDGRKQEFQKQKIIRTCLRMRATQEQAMEIANRIEKQAYDGIRTKKIIKLIFKYLKEIKPEIGYQIDLREAIALLRPRPDFERFVQLILEAYGYEVIPNLIVRGKCGEHEIDAIAKKGNEVIYVEVKHHFNSHTYTGKDIFLQARATLEDLAEGYKARKNSFNVNKVLVICNTKYSNHAKRYADCRGIEHMGWKDPLEKGLERMIEERKLYPITFLKGLDGKSKERFLNAGIILLKQLVEYNIDNLYKETRIQKKKLENFIEKAREILT